MFQLREQPYSAQDAEWDAFVAAHPHGSVLQTTNWARLKGRFNWRSERVWVRHDGRLVAGAQILYRSAALNLVRFGYIPHGPLVDWDNAEAVDVLLNQIDVAGFKHRAAVTKLEPAVWQDEPAAAGWAAACARHALRRDTDSVQPPRTMLLDLSADDETLLATFKTKTRYNIRLAERKAVTTRLGTAADLPAFNALMQQTGARNAFGVHAPEYYAAMFDLFNASGDAALVLADYAGQPLAGALILKCGRRASYIAGGSSDAERNRMPTYAVQWAAIQWARAHGCTQYDLWGLPDAEPDVLEAEFETRNDGLWGVYRFKRGFGGQIARTVGSADRVTNSLTYRLYRRQRGLR